jgi:hypothetical protein
VVKAVRKLILKAMGHTLCFWQLPISGIYAVHAGLCHRKVQMYIVLFYLYRSLGRETGDSDTSSSVCRRRAVLPCRKLLNILQDEKS